LIYSIASSSGQSEWNYQIHGPDVWPHIYPSCDGEKQSPINIEKKDVTYNPTLKPITFKDYDVFHQWNVTHNGHSSKHI